MSNNLTNANEKSENVKRSPLKLSTVKVSEPQKPYAFKSCFSENNIKAGRQVKKKSSDNEQQIVDGFSGLTLDSTDKSSLEYLDLKIEGGKTGASSSAPSLEKTGTFPKPGSSSQNNLKWEQTRRNRKEYKRKNKKGLVQENSIPVEGRENADEPRKSQSNEGSFNNDGQFFPKNTKSVVFTKDVLVVYFNGEHIVNESKEPLKKEMEQQMRNKEMRKTHLIKTQEKYNLCLF